MVFEVALDLGPTGSFLNSAMVYRLALNEKLIRWVFPVA